MSHSAKSFPSVGPQHLINCAAYVLACLVGVVVLSHPHPVAAQGCGSPPDQTGIHTTFETGTREGWGPRIGRETVAVTNADQRAGTFSLLTTGRQAAFDGPSINATGKMCNGSQYKISLWVKLAPGQPNSSLRLSLQRNLGGVSNFNTVIGNTAVTANQWVRLKTTYTFRFNYDSLSLYVESSSGTASFYIDDFDLSYLPPPTVEAIPSVAEAYSSYFDFGAAVWAGDLSGVHAELLTKHHNSVTAENDMKWDALGPSDGVFTFTAGDNIVNFARARNLKVRGHALVWHNQTPNWVFLNNGVDMSTQPFSEANKALLLQRMRNHIRAVVQHYGANIFAWDVVNEPFDENQADGFRRSKWFLIIGGPEYIDRAFQYAREAVDELGLPPQTIKLYLNEFSTTVPSKRDFMFNYVAGALGRGVPIDGVGHQFHNNVNFPLNGSLASFNDVIAAINKFSDLGLDQQVTEFDISIYRVNAPGQVIYSDYDDIVALNQPTLIELGYRYRDYFNIFKQLKGKISSVTLWGQADDHTWRTSGSTVNAPLLFDTGLQHKYAYTGVMNPEDLPGAGIVPGTIQLITTATLQKLGDGSYRATVKVRNQGSGTVQNVWLTSSSLGAANGTPMPQTLVNIAPGAEATTTVNFPSSAGASGAAVVERYKGNYSGGTFAASIRATLP